MDIVERLRRQASQEDMLTCEDMLLAADEIERLRELLRGVGANRYWEGRWRDAEAEIERLEVEVVRLRAEIVKLRAERAKLRGAIARMAS